MTKSFGFYSNSRGADEIKDLSISIDFQIQKHGVVTPVQYITPWFLLALSFAFSKMEMFKLLFILFVVKQLLGNLTSDIDIYSAKLTIIQLGKAKWW